MAPTIVTSGSKRSSTGVWAVAAVVVWVIVAALTISYFWDRTDVSDGALAAAQSTMTGSIPAGSGPGSATTLAASATTSEATTTTTTEATTTTQSTTTTTAPPVLTVAAGGDVLGDRGVGLFIDKKGAAPLFANVRPLFEAASIAFVNPEGPISDKGSRATWKEYTFRGRTELAEGLASGGIDVVSLANNHANDYGAKALLDMLVRLREAGVHYAGAGSPAHVGPPRGAPCPSETAGERGPRLYPPRVVVALLLHLQHHFERPADALAVQQRLEHRGLPIGGQCAAARAARRREQPAQPVLSAAGA